MKIVRPSLDELKACFEIEQDYQFDRSESENTGFFLPGTNFQIYENILETGFARILLSNDGEVAAFTLVLPPGHAIVVKLLTDDDAMFIFDTNHDFHPSTSAWIAKIATTRRHLRQGFAKELYAAIFHEFAGANLLTATALSPKRNIPSEKFHQSMGMRTIGVFVGGSRPPISTTVNTVWARRISQSFRD